MHSYHTFQHQACMVMWITFRLPVTKSVSPFPYSNCCRVWVIRRVKKRAWSC